MHAPRLASPSEELVTERFLDRHIGPRDGEIARMLQVVGVQSLDGLIAETVPGDIRQQHPLTFGPALGEADLLEKLRQIASHNSVLVSLIGQGFYRSHLPPVIQRNVLENPAWYTAYTPYQPEVSQGRLEALLNFQTMVSDLTGLEIANASLLDEPTSAAEAMSMARRITRSDSQAFFVDVDCHPQTIEVVRTRAEPLGWDIVVGDLSDLDPKGVFGALLQYPGSSGRIRSLEQVVASLHAADAIAVVATDLLALCQLVPPGEFGADIAVGSTQRFGVPMGYGGPHAAFIACRSRHQRALPGRLVGISVDARGRPAYRLALQTREQHIRREKATSNICTAQVLLAVIASMYAVYHGADGLRRIARSVAHIAAVLAEGLTRRGWNLVSESFFDTVVVLVGDARDEIIRRARQDGINLRPLPGAIGISCDETTTVNVVERVWAALGTGGRFFPEKTTFAQLSLELSNAIPDALRRTSPYLQNSVFERHRSETDMLRYLRYLSDKDLALDRTMIPLGSCTMKLNATAEMMPLTWPSFSDLHPFAPGDQASGYAEMVLDLKSKLMAISGYDAVSLQPNSGAQGEYAGLLAIRAYHRSRGDAQRTICLIPNSAHGTNPASAQMAGMDVVPVSCDAAGNVDIADLTAKAKHYSGRLAAIMITYPSTHGVFERSVREICNVVHELGGQVYLDGANLNAQVGLARPGDYGADVSHFNLHKTFCIPHGGGGPGMGPIGVKSHLAPFLPRGPLEATGNVGPVAGAPFGSGSILTIAWAYMLLMGGDGLTQATKIAILSANYIARRLAPHYSILFSGENGRVAHECILDLRPLKEATAVTVDDVAKRLVDYGLHAPTMSFPVPGTLMIEPTESEPLAELDRFCAAMISIRREIREIESGGASKVDNRLKNAPHTALDLADEDWSHPYSRMAACFPSGQTAVKYWPPVNRIDNAYGDRNLICSCVTMFDAD